MGLAAEEDEVQGWSVEKGDPTAELARGRELLRGAVSYFEVVIRVKKIARLASRSTWTHSSARLKNAPSFETAP